MTRAAQRPVLVPRTGLPVWDWQLLAVILALASVGLVFVYSASIPYAGEKLADPGFFLRRQEFYVLVAALAIAIVSQIPVDFWRRAALPLALLGIGLLVLVLIPGIRR